MSEKKQLTILQVNDSHGYLESHPELYWTGTGAKYEEVGGYSRIATIFKKARQGNPDGVLTLDNGDTFHGTFLAVNRKGEALIPILNEMDFDAMTAHWEFAYGPDHLRGMIQKLDYPLLAINCYHEDTDKLVFPPYQIL